MRQRYVVAVLLLLAASPHAYELIETRQLAHDTDEGRQIMAARSMYEGRGYTIPVADRSDNFALREQHLTQYPPGYSYILATVHRTGLSWNSTALAVKLFLLLIALVGWYRITAEVLGHLVGAAALMLVLPFRFDLNPTDFILISAFPVFALLLIQSTKTEQRTRVGVLLILAILGAGLIWIKYTAVYFVVAAALFLVVDGWVADRFRNGLLSAGIVSVLPAVSFLAANYWNIRQSGAASSHLAGGIHSIGLTDTLSVVLNPLQAVLLGTLKLDYLARGISGVADRIYDPGIGVANGLVVVALLGLILYVLVRYRYTNETGRRAKDLFDVFVFFLLASGLFLVAMDLFVIRDSSFGLGQRFVASSTFRYYTPFAALLIVFLVRSAMLEWRTGARWLGICAALLLSMLVLYSAKELARKAGTGGVQFEDGVALLHSVAERAQSDEPRVVIGHAKVICMMTAARIANSPPLNDEFWAGLTPDQPSTLVMVQSRRYSSTPYLVTFDEMVDRFGMNVEKRSHWEVAFKRFGAQSDSTESAAVHESSPFTR